MSTYASYQLIARDIPKSLDRIGSQPVVERETEYYLANIGNVKSIDEFVKNDRLFKYAMNAFGLGDMSYAKAFMVKALKEGVTDPDSFANKLTDKRYAEFVKAFNFAKLGDAATTYNGAQTDVPKNYALQVDLGVVKESFAFTEAETSYYISNIGNVKSVDDLLNDPRLLDYAMATFGLDSETEPAATVRQMLEGGVSDPQSPANQLADKRYAAFVTIFDFAQHGADTTSRTEVQDGVPKNYVNATGMGLIKPSAEYIKGETDYFLANIGKVRNVTDLLANKRLLTYAMATYGLDASTETPKTIRKMLEGGVSDPLSPANQLADKSYAEFAAAFNFAEFGDQATSQDSVLKDTTRLYTAKSSLGLIKPGDDYVAAETSYYLAHVGDVKSIDDLFADKRLYNYVLSSYGLDPGKQDPKLIRSVLEGGIRDPESVANKLANKAYAGLAAAFNFEAYGEDATTYQASHQPVVDKYMRQTLEEDAGKTNEGVRLALYFERKAPALTNWYEVLADKALATVIRTAFGLSDSFASADIDKQVKLFESKMDIPDFADPEKLGEFMTRFTSLYEIQNPTSTAQTSVSVLFSQPTTIGVSTDLLMAMQQLRF
ncbi:DUF1217 domain-containing protein [Mesorhizobium sp. Root1471]|uniref:DUF1217 domain-containing protein n=1 Tax=Mesorhizobium sp. Root1471 TaxID=1736469 RepID=UPI001FCD3D33|nr:DUF1217 domain-containing protein [Mesorhizobium sp. Root1471]